jgi:Tol biopolymer transport system component
MKTRMKNILVLSAVSLILAVSLTLARQAGEPPAVLLERAIQLESVDGDLGAAIDLYKRIAADSGSSRAVVARALLHLGGCYEKLGLDEARKAYERLMRDYADQSEQAKEAQIRLAALGKPAGEGKESNLSTRLVWAGADGVFDNAPSPDGKYIAYVDFESGNLAIRDLKANTSRLLTNEGTWEEPIQTAYSSRWSPDGKQIAYHWYKGSEAQLRIMAMDNRQSRILFRDNSEGAWLETKDWSPDGENILVWIGANGRSNQLVLIPVKGGSPRMIKTFELETISAGGGLFSPDGRYIVYSRTPGKVAALDIFVMDVNGGVETPLVQHPADDSLFGWSPDGNWILFLSDRAGTFDFWAIRVANGKPQGDPIRVKRSVGRVAPLGFAKDGSFYYADVKVARDIYAAKIDFQTGKVLEPPKKAITWFEGSNMNPSYSPDGKWLAYVSRRGGMVFPTNLANALCIHSLESGTERVFMDEFVKLGIRSVAGPRWAPDSLSLVVAGLQVVGSGRGVLYQLSLDTGKVSPVVEMPPGVQTRNHEFSAEGQRLLYVRDDRNRKLLQILVRDLRTGEEHELYRASLGNEEPGGIALSPDGERLAMLSINRRVLSVMPSEGGKPRVIHRFDRSRNTNPEWTRNGRYVLIGSGDIGKGILYRIAVEDGQIQEINLLTSPESSARRAIWDRISLHPDGRQIAFTTQFNTDSDADVWVMQNFLPLTQRR